MKQFSFNANVLYGEKHIVKNQEDQHFRLQNNNVLFLCTVTSQPVLTIGQSW